MKTTKLLWIWVIPFLKKIAVETALINDSLRRQNAPDRIIGLAGVWLMVGKTMLNVDDEPFIAEVNSNTALQQFLTSSTLYLYGDQI